MSFPNGTCAALVQLEVALCEAGHRREPWTERQAVRHRNPRLRPTTPCRRGWGSSEETTPRRSSDVEPRARVCRELGASGGPPRAGCFQKYRAAASQAPRAGRPRRSRTGGIGVPMTTFLDNRRTEVRWAFRSLRRAPGTSALAVVSLALGIGANTAIFSLVNAVLLKMLPVASPQELYLVAVHGERPRVYWNYPDYVAFRDRAKGFAGLAAGSGVDSVGLQAAEGGATGPAELVQNQFVSGNYFQVLGVRPALGRLFNPEDDRAFGGAPWAILSFDFWRSRFAADPRVVGRTIRLNGYPLTII